MEPSGSTGKVYLVGGGSGDPGLLTLRGQQCLALADVVMYDYLVNPVLLRHCRPEAKLVCLGQHGRSRIWPQDEINAHLIAYARAGNAVVRLKSGDPAVFARGAEECLALRQAAIEFEMVPGITAAIAAASFAGIPITHRDHASAVALVTGHEKADKEGPAVDYKKLAQFPGTIVFYMGVTSAGEWSRDLLSEGKPASTPIAIVRRVSFPDQSIHLTTLGDVAQFVKQTGLRPPVVFIVGEVVNLRDELTWFDRRPLFGTTVLVTRPAQQAESLARPLEELGAAVLLDPAIVIGMPEDSAPLVQAIHTLETYDWLVFASASGVEKFFEQLISLSYDLRKLAHIRLAVVGSGTSAALERFHLRADLVPENFEAESLAAMLAPEAAGKRVLIVRASRGREVLPQLLANSGAWVEQVIAYQSVDNLVPDPLVVQRLTERKIDYISVTSSAIATSLVNRYGDLLRSAKLASLSPITSATIRSLGHEVAVEATLYTMAGLVEAIMHDRAQQ